MSEEKEKVQRLYAGSPNVNVLIQRLRAANADGLREQAYQSLCGDAADALSLPTAVPQAAWQPIETAPKYETIMAWWLNGEQHTGSTDGEKWFPAWEHQDNKWMMPQLWMPLVEPDEATAKAATASALSRPK